MIEKIIKGEICHTALRYAKANNKIYEGKLN